MNRNPFAGVGSVWSFGCRRTIHEQPKHKKTNFFRLLMYGRQKNKETLALAEAVLAKRIVEMQNKEFGFARRQSSIGFADYYVTVADQRRTASSRASWHYALDKIKAYDSRITMRRLSDIDIDWVSGFRKFLLSSPLSTGTAAVCWKHLATLFNTAVRERLIRENPVKAVPAITFPESERMHLTVDELRRLAACRCSSEVVRRAFLFSCLTGLRYSDLASLTWSEITRQDGYTRIVFRQRKTGGREYLDITPQATALLGTPSGPDTRIFPLQRSYFVNKHLKHWVAGAGISKHITFHCARHTFAVMMLDLGVDIYTVSKLLGHRELSTTQIYARVLDKNKQAAVAKIPDIL